MFTFFSFTTPFRWAGRGQRIQKGVGPLFLALTLTVPYIFDILLTPPFFIPHQMETFSGPNVISEHRRHSRCLSLPPNLSPDHGPRERPRQKRHHSDTNLDLHELFLQLVAITGTERRNSSICRTHSPQSYSIATSSTQLHESPLSNIIPPQHPYSLYPQTAISEGIGSSQAWVPEYTTNYRTGRDLIGPDGYIEQLPPYSSSNHIQIHPSEEGKGQEQASTNPDHHLQLRDCPGCAMSSLDIPRRQCTTEEGRQPTEEGSTANENLEKTTKSQSRAHALRMPTLALIVSLSLVAVICGATGGTFAAKRSSEAGKEQGTETTVAKTDFFYYSNGLACSI